jgi:hypothetical protein
MKISRRLDKQSSQPQHQDILKAKENETSILPEGEMFGSQGKHSQDC